MATSHIDFRKIDYDQLIDKPIIRTDAGVDTLTTAGVYDKGDWKRYIVSVDGQNITQVIEEKDWYQTRSSTDGGTTWGEWTTVQFADDDKKWDKVIISSTEPTEKIETTAWIDLSDDDAFKVWDWTQWIKVSWQSIQVEEIPTASADEYKKIYQYIWPTTQDYTHWYFYECVSDGAIQPTYSWENIDVQENKTTQIEYKTQEEYNALTPEEKADENKHYVIYEVGILPVEYTKATFTWTSNNYYKRLTRVDELDENDQPTGNYIILNWSSAPTASNRDLTITITTYDHGASVGSCIVTIEDWVPTSSVIQA